MNNQFVQMPLPNMEVATDQEAELVERKRSSMLSKTQVHIG